MQTIRLNRFHPEDRQKIVRTKLTLFLDVTKTKQNKTNFNGTNKFHQVIRISNGNGNKNGISNCEYHVNENPYSVRSTFILFDRYQTTKCNMYLQRREEIRVKYLTYF